MGKIIIEGSIKNEKEVDNFIVKAIMNDNTIKYKKDDSLYKIIIFNNMVMLKKKNNESEVEFNFKNNIETICKYNIYGRTLELKIFTNKLEINEDRIYIEYTVEDIENVIFDIKIKGMSDKYDN